MKDVQEMFHGKMYRHMNQYLIYEQNMDLTKNKFILIGISTIWPNFENCLDLFRSTTVQNPMQYVIVQD